MLVVRGNLEITPRRIRLGDGREFSYGNTTRDRDVEERLCPAEYFPEYKDESFFDTGLGLAVAAVSTIAVIASAYALAEKFL